MDAALNDLQLNLGDTTNLTQAMTLVNFKDYLHANEQYIDMSNTIVRYLSIDPTIVNYALFAVDFQSIDMAMDYIYEEEVDLNGNAQMRHPYVACLPELDEFKLEGQGDDLERGVLDQFKVCYICK